MATPGSQLCCFIDEAGQPKINPTEIFRNRNFQTLERSLNFCFTQIDLHKDEE